MITAFDTIASSYDTSFTRSAIGLLQRRRVWNYLDKILPHLEGKNILELNCGTGEDALTFSERGFTVLATDYSNAMLDVARKKFSVQERPPQITLNQLDLNHFSSKNFSERYDLVFSNFGGLNCLSASSLKHLITTLPHLLHPKGRFIAVIMPKYCLWESFYFLSQGKIKKAFRRWTSKPVVAQLESKTTEIWYYNPKQLAEWSYEHFEVINTFPVGLTIPPSYLENFFLKKANWLNRLYQWEGKLENPLVASLSDHFCIDLQLKSHF